MISGKITLQAGQELPIKAVGNFVYITSAGAQVKIKGEGINVLLNSSQGTQGDKQFKSLTIENTSNAVNEVQYVFGSGAFYSSEISGDVSASIKQAAVLTESTKSAGLVAVELVAANAGRKMLHVRNNSVNNIYIGGQNVSTASAIKLAPDEEWREAEASVAKWYVIADAAASSVAIIEGV